MNSDCLHEKEIIKAVLEGNWTNELRAHVDSCASCRLSEQLFISFQQIKTETEQRATFLRFEHILIESELQKETLRAQRLNRLISFGTWGAVAASFIFISLFNRPGDWTTLQSVFSFFNFQTVVFFVLLLVLTEAPLHLLFKVKLKVIS